MRKSKTTNKIIKGLQEAVEYAKRSKREVCLDAAKNMVMSSREAEYSSPADNHMTISNMWENYYGAKLLRTGGVVTFDSHDVAIFNILQKIARLAVSPKKLDTWTDIAGYAACGAETSEAE